MNTSLLAFAILIAFESGVLPTLAQDHYKSFVVSTYAVQGTVQELMNGDLDPAVLDKPHAQSQSRQDLHRSHAQPHAGE